MGAQHSSFRIRPRNAIRDVSTSRRFTSSKTGQRRFRHAPPTLRVNTLSRQKEQFVTVSL
jgi:hypothetical protein